MVMLAVWLSPAQANILFYRLFKNISYVQTSNAQPTTPSGFFAGPDVIASDPADLAAAQVTYSGPLSPLSLMNAGPGFFIFNKSYATQAAMDTEFPPPGATTYQYTISGGNLGMQTASLTTPATNLFAPQIPFVTNFSQLQGLDPTAPFTVTWPGYTPAMGINDPLLFFSITRISDNQSVFGIGAPNTQTSVLLPANTLQLNTAYRFELDYSSRIRVDNAGFGGAASTVAFDARVTGTFTTAVTPIPEPGSLVLLGLGGLGLVGYGWRRRKQTN
jgi:hypothetical protein